MFIIQLYLSGTTSATYLVNSIIAEIPLAQARKSTTSETLIVAKFKRGGGEVLGRGMPNNVLRMYCTVYVPHSIDLLQKYHLIKTSVGHFPET